MQLQLDLHWGFPNQNWRNAWQPSFDIQLILVFLHEIQDLAQYLKTHYTVK